MKKILTALLFTFFIITVTTVNKTHAQELIDDQSLVLTPKEAIKIYTEKYDIPFDWIYKTAEGESGFNQNAIHDGGMGKGCTGYWKDTFYGHKKKYLSKYPEIKSLKYSSCLDQLHMMTIAIKEGRGWEWTEWCKNFAVRGETCNWYFRKLDKGLL